MESKQEYPITPIIIKYETVKKLFYMGYPLIIRNVKMPKFNNL
jgi:hypothetical protein